MSTEYGFITSDPGHLCDCVKDIRVSSVSITSYPKEPFIHEYFKWIRVIYNCTRSCFICFVDACKFYIVHISYFVIQTNTCSTDLVHFKCAIFQFRLMSVVNLTKLNQSTFSIFVSPF